MDPLPDSFMRKPFSLLTDLSQTSAPPWSVVWSPTSSLDGYDFKEKLKKNQKTKKTKKAIQCTFIKHGGSETELK